jgi:hypothetical protein
MSAPTTSGVDDEFASPMGESSQTRQGDLALLTHPVAQELLRAKVPARLAYVARDGTPRVIPLLFGWTGEEVALFSWPDDPKVAALRGRPEVAVTIDTETWPFHVLLLRGVAKVTIIDGIPADMPTTFVRYFGPEQGHAMVAQMARMSDQQARIAIRPTWAGVLDFETRFPSGMTRRMGGPEE